MPTTAGAAVAAACPPSTWWGRYLRHKRFLSLASLWAVCESVAVRVLFEADYSSWRSANEASLHAGRARNSKRYNGRRGEGRNDRRRSNMYAVDDDDERPSFQPPHIQRKLGKRKRVSQYHSVYYGRDDYTELSEFSKYVDADISAGGDEWDDDLDGTTFHIFQIAKPHTGSTLLNCILQGLLEAKSTTRHSRSKHAGGNY